MDRFIIKERLKLLLWLVGAGVFFGVFATWHAWGQVGIAGEGRERYLLGATTTAALAFVWVVLLVAQLAMSRREKPGYKARPRQISIPWWAIKIAALCAFVAAMAFFVVKYGERGIDEFALLESGQLGALKERIARNPQLLERRDKASGKTLLELAMESENAKALDVLLHSGAGLAEVAGRLNLSASLGNVQMLQVLLDHGANPNRPDAGGFFPLHLAAASGNTNALVLLLAAGADPNQPDPSSQTPILAAVMRDDLPTVRCLLEHGADVNLCSKEGDTALHLAVRRSNLETSRLLLENGADAEAVDGAGLRPLDIAARNGQNELVALFLDDPERVRWVNKDDLAAFDQAIRRQKFGTARLLLEHGAEIDRVMASGYTATHLMIVAKEYRTAQFLIEAGAGVDIANAEGETALDLMRTKQIRMLLDLVESRTRSPEPTATNAVESVETP